MLDGNSNNIKVGTRCIYFSDEFTSQEKEGRMKLAIYVVPKHLGNLCLYEVKYTNIILIVY